MFHLEENKICYLTYIAEVQFCFLRFHSCIRSSYNAFLDFIFGYEVDTVLLTCLLYQ